MSNRTELKKTSDKLNLKIQIHESQERVMSVQYNKYENLAVMTMTVSNFDPEFP